MLYLYLKRFTFTEDKAFFLLLNNHELNSFPTHHLELIKGHGSENMFFIIDNLNLQWDDNNKKHLTTLLCQKNNVLQGADGVLFMEPGLHTPHLMRIFNADGSEALMCGNGMRLAGRWSLEKLHSQNCTVENVTHLPYSIQRQDNFTPNVYAVELSLPAANLLVDFLHADTKPPFVNQVFPTLDPNHTYTAVAMPNPHIIALLQNTINDSQLETIGSLANSQAQIFKDGVNVSWAKVIDPSTLYVSTFERGVGLTNSCGTAMVAATVTACIQNLTDKNANITVLNKGGFITVKVMDDLSAKMTGNATYLAYYSINIEDGNLTILEQENTKEQLAYDLLKK